MPGPTNVIQISHTHPIYSKVIALRREVLRLPLGLDFSEEDLIADHEWATLTAIGRGYLVHGCCLIKETAPGRAQLRQMAVSPTKQGKGVGAKLVDAAEKWCRNHDIHELYMHARATAVDFYKKQGYAVDENVGCFSEVGIPHFLMYKRLD